MKPSFFTYMDVVAAKFLERFPALTQLFENAADDCVALFELDLIEPTPSKILVKFLFRSNLNYLIGSYIALLQTNKSFSYSGARIVFEGIIRAYYYLCNKEAACASYLYMVTHGGPDSPGLDDQDVAVLNRVIKQVEDAELKQLCEKVIQKGKFTDDEKKKISEFDEPSRDIKRNIAKIYTQRQGKDMKEVWSTLSRTSHAGFKGRFNDLRAPVEEELVTYERDLGFLLSLMVANMLVYLETIDPVGLDLMAFKAIIAGLRLYPKYTPNKEGLIGLFKYSTKEDIDVLLSI